ncbi:CDP-glycerol glycerophosphotransferase family protein [Arthrobacter rhombi]|uniref:CDP-glycerol glycerophosphotransferase family protein n=1 Tax=Arthrobacter rhombi TaxID=71253 RepID=UPI003FD3599E
MPLGTKLSTAVKRSLSQLSSALMAPVVRRRAERRNQQMPKASPFVAYFADGPEGTYQLEQWIPAFQRLAGAGTPVTLLMTNAISANRLLQAGNLPVVLCTDSADTEDFVRKHDVQVIFYVNNNQANFTTLRINGPSHVHLSHGESEKSSMVSNQLKAYDAVFIAGPASRDRIISHVQGINPTCLVQIGRPQLDVPSSSSKKQSDRTTVLYAPTWEGDGSAMAYSSLADLGQSLVKLLTADDRIHTVFRPHPKTGTRSRKYVEALRYTNRLINNNAAPVGSARETLVQTTDALTAIYLADVVVTDVSAMAMDAVGLNKPVLVLQTAPPTATGATSGLTSAVPTWCFLPDDAVQQILNLAVKEPDTRQNEFREYVFGTSELGTGTDRFIQAAQALLNSPTGTSMG